MVWEKDKKTRKTITFQYVVGFFPGFFKTPIKKGPHKTILGKGNPRSMLITC
jgi:hypothetical protein